MENMEKMVVAKNDTKNDTETFEFNCFYAECNVNVVIENTTHVYKVEESDNVTVVVHSTKPFRASLIRPGETLRAVAAKKFKKNKDKYALRFIPNKAKKIESNLLFIAEQTIGEVDKFLSNKRRTENITMLKRCMHFIATNQEI